MIFETHAHYDDEKFNEDREELISSLFRDFNIEYIVNAGCDMKSSYAGLELSRKWKNFYAAVGIHPHSADEYNDENTEKLRELSNDPKAVAIGEIGLDYYYDFCDREVQRKCFRAQLDLAAEVGLPVIIHSREAAAETFNIIKESRVRQGVIHSYSGHTEMALEYIKLGFYIGIGGMITFKNAKKSLEVVKNLPLERILTETDSPYLAPVPVRGHRNDSRNLRYIIEKISEIKQISPEKVEETTRKNALSLFDKKIIVA
ncbi:MAG: TatD family hydrolase [Clostridiales bacterium]|nr:TatD family hydrolase [Clostridiales bacterium]